MTAEYPGATYSPRTKENKSGVVYDAAKKTVGFAEDFIKLDEEVVAIETELGTDASGAYATVKAWLTALAGAIVTAFTGLTDTPANYTGEAGKAVLVKATEDGLEFGEAGAAVGGKYGINVETLSADKTLTPNTDEIYQYLDEGGATRIITIVTAGASAGDRFIIRHNGAHNDGHYLWIKQDTTTIDFIYVGAIKKFIFDGTNWIPVSTGTGENDDKSDVIAIGMKANGNFHGIAIGKMAVANSYGIGIGYNCKGDSYGIAIGNGAVGKSYGVGIGKSADGQDKGVAVGYNADTNQKYYSTALGYNSETERYSEMARNINGGDADQENNITSIGLEKQTADATPIEMLCGGQANQRITIRAKSVLTFTILISARDNVSGDCAAYKFEGAIKRDAAGNTTLLVANKTVIHEDDATWDVAVTADDTNEALKIEVTGDAANIVQWAARLDGVETHF